MGRKVILGVILAIVVFGAYYLYTTSRSDQSMYNGDVHAVNPGPSKSSSDDYSQPNSKNNLNTPAPSQTSNQPPGGAPAPPPDPPTSTLAVQPAAPLPARDTVAPNPPNGVAFTGTGHYQWYRQGNLTWRVDTQNGNSCIAFATDEEWRKPRVYNSGCGNR